jgi:hypothetical protein
MTSDLAACGVGRQHAQRRDGRDVVRPAAPARGLRQQQRQARHDVGARRLEARIARMERDRAGSARVLKQQPRGLFPVHLVHLHARAQDRAPDVLARCRYATDSEDA